MKLGNTKYALTVFAAGAIYGLSGPLVKFAYADGWTWQQMAFAQPFLASVLFAIVCFFYLAPKRQLKRIGSRQTVNLLLLGVINSLTTLLYMFSLSRLPVAVALTMLFQFAWLGIALQLFLERRGPNLYEIGAAGLVLAGTIMTTGILHEDLGALDPIGILAGFGAGVSYTLYLHFNGRFGIRMPAAQRGLYICLGSSVVTFFFCPNFFMQPLVHSTLLQDAMPVALTAQLIPVVLLGLSTPHLPTGIISIMASSELPSGIIASAFMLSEYPESVQVVGVVAVLAGIIVSQIPALRE